jgi:hypothetical protein
MQSPPRRGRDPRLPAMLAALDLDGGAILRRRGGQVRTRSVTMDCEIRNHHVRYREHIFVRENCCCVCCQTNLFIDLAFQRPYVLTGAAEIGVAI